MKVFSILEASRRLSVAPKTVRDRRWRERVGLPLTRIGRRTGVLAEDLETLVRGGRERLLLRRKAN